MFKKTLLLNLLIIFMVSCTESKSDTEAVYGCCDENAYNYSEDVTIHADSLCIYPFEFLSPLETDIWEINSLQSIDWTGGDSDLNVYISINDADTDAHEFTVSESTLNTGTHQWTIDENEISTGNKRIYIAQDLNSDGSIDSDNDLYAYSDDFIIIDETIEAFEIAYPFEGLQFVEGTIETIEWDGGSMEMPLKLSLISSETDESDWFTLGTIVLEIENTGFYEWTVDCFGECEGPKWIAIEQDWNGDEDDQYGYQYMYSDQFEIIER